MKFVTVLSIQLKFTHSRYKILVSYLSEPVCAEPQLLIPLFIDQEWCSTCTWIIILDLLQNYFGQKYWQMKYIFYNLGTYPTSLHVFTSYLLHILLFGENYLIWFFTWYDILPLVPIIKGYTWQQNEHELCQQTKKIQHMCFLGTYLMILLIYVVQNRQLLFFKPCSNAKKILWNKHRKVLSGKPKI